jgi:hypothetical protein
LAQRRIVRHGPVQLRHLKQAGHHSGRLTLGQLNRTLMVRQNWIAASENSAGQPGLP